MENVNHVTLLLVLNALIVQVIAQNVRMINLFMKENAIHLVIKLMEMLVPTQHQKNATIVYY